MIVFERHWRSQAWAHVHAWRGLPAGVRMTALRQ